VASFILISLDGFYEGPNGKEDRLRPRLDAVRQFDSGNVLLTGQPWS
jgi:hypothetical protein